MSERKIFVWNAAKVVDNILNSTQLRIFFQMFSQINEKKN